ncbi:MAG: CBS domain-containing protein [Desulfatitalea sp.]|nr:CBS domain-containing protein [Desulfatitalea sp.]NNK01033.1 CBS domain-containing protein [Desulfatitalea sp.]
MVPLSEYAVIPEDASIYDAILALEKAQQAFDQNQYMHRAILVEGKDGKIVGKLGQLDVLQALEPKYAALKSDTPGMAKFGFTKKFLLSMLETYKMFDKPLDDLCIKAGMEKIGKYMHRPTEGEFIDEQDAMDQAIHLLVVGHHQSLLVTRGENIVGILRLTDVFAFVFHAMKECGINNH